MAISVISLTGKTAAVIGGSSGIGLATAGLLSGASVVMALCDRNAGRLAQAEQGLRSHFPDVRLSAAMCGVLGAAQMVAFADAVEQTVGPVGTLVNNAGQDRVSTFVDTDGVAWTQEPYLKFFSTIHSTRAFMPQLECPAHGTIVRVNSLFVQQPEPHMVATSTARAGMLNPMRSMATELAPKDMCVSDILVGLVESGR